jgi:anti-sigma regulatory factor (Ser/Thr protein kinase)
LGDRQLVVTVTDDGQWRPGVQQDAPERGRGFVMIEQLSDDVRIETGPFGTSVTLFWSDVGQEKT